MVKIIAYLMVRIIAYLMVKIRYCEVLRNEQFYYYYYYTMSELSPIYAR